MIKSTCPKNGVFLEQWMDLNHTLFSPEFVSSGAHFLVLFFFSKTDEGDRVFHQKERGRLGTEGP